MLNLLDILVFGLLIAVFVFIFCAFAEVSDNIGVEGMPLDEAIQDAIENVREKNDVARAVKFGLVGMVVCVLGKIMMPRFGIK